MGDGRSTLYDVTPTTTSGASVHPPKQSIHSHNLLLLSTRHQHPPGCASPPDEERTRMWTAGERQTATRRIEILASSVRTQTKKANPIPRFPHISKNHTKEEANVAAENSRQYDNTKHTNTLVPFLIQDNVWWQWQSTKERGISFASNATGESSERRRP